MKQIRNSNNLTASQVKKNLELTFNNELLEIITITYDTLEVIFKLHQIFNIDGYIKFATITVTNEIIEFSVNTPLQGTTQELCESAFFKFLESKLQ